MDRFSEVIGDNTSGTDVITGETLDLADTVVVPARGVYVLELEKR